jgi:hypothetical protein
VRNNSGLCNAGLNRGRLATNIPKEAAMPASPLPLDPIRRPALLIRAVRAGLGLYRRERDLRRLLGHVAAPTPGRALAALIEAEATEEDRRLTSDAAYDPARHIGLLIALLAEMRLVGGPGRTLPAGPAPAPCVVARGAGGSCATLTQKPALTALQPARVRSAAAVRGAA